MMRLWALLLVLGLAGCFPPARPPSGRPVVVALGDSVPAGTACGCTSFPDLYARQLSPPAASVNLAQAGYTSSDVRGQITTTDVRADLHEASIVLVMIGANDLADAFESSRADADYQAAADSVATNVAAIVAAVLQAHATPLPVLVLGYWNVVKDGAVGRAEYGAAGLRSAEQATRYCNQALRAAARQSGARYVTTTPAFKGTSRDEDPTGLLAADGDHPNAAGHQAIADAVHTAQPTP
jgi:acyl-CoA thioesterase-1